MVAKTLDRPLGEIATLKVSKPLVAPGAAFQYHNIVLFKDRFNTPNSR
jgi:hypothetical protein